MISVQFPDRKAGYRLIFSLTTLILVVFILIPSFSHSSEQSYHFVHNIVIDRADSNTIYLATDNQGIIKSIDGGKTWKFINQGIKNYLVYDLKLSVVTPGRLYASTWGGGFYQSENGGSSWKEINEGLSNTAIGRIEVQVDPQRLHDHLIISTSTELYKRRDDETSWHSIGNPAHFWNGPQFQNALVIEPESGILFLGTEYGVFSNIRGKQGWKEVAPLKGQRISAMRVRADSGGIYAASIGEGGLYVSHNRGTKWQTIKGLKTKWIREILFDPSVPGRLYLATSDNGVMKSDNDGVSWSSINVGLPDRDVRTLSLDLKHPEHLFAGLHGAGLFSSTNSGETWTKVEGLPFDSVEKQMTFIDAQNCPSPNRRSNPPDSFTKCNQCHGWGDPILNQKTTYWRVAANRRNWAETVNRMIKGTTINENEQVQIINFLNQYSGFRSNRRGSSATERDNFQIKKNKLPIDENGAC